MSAAVAAQVAAPASSVIGNGSERWRSRLAVAMAAPAGIRPRAAAMANVARCAGVTPSRDSRITEVKVNRGNVYSAPPRPAWLLAICSTPTTSNPTARTRPVSVSQVISARQPAQDSCADQQVAQFCVTRGVGVGAVAVACLPYPRRVGVQLVGHLDERRLMLVTDCCQAGRE